MTLNEYSVTINGHETTLQLDDEDAALGRETACETGEETTERVQREGLIS